MSLPGLDLERDNEWEAVWALLDSGSSVHVADAPKHLSGASVRPRPSYTRSFQAADGTTIPHRGHTVTHMRMNEAENATGWDGEIAWKHATVAMPTL